MLQRCVASIPRRDDVQIIVVDDCSDAVAWDGIQFLDDRCIEKYSTPHNGGGGLARNVGLDHAQGRWLLFADCDDYYADGFLDILDHYRESDADIVYFNFAIDNRGINNDSTIRSLQTLQNKLARGEENEDFVRYQVFPPWDKMVSRRFVDKYNIRFEPVIRGNDIQFTLYTGYLSRKRLFIPDTLYVYVLNPSSVSFVKYNAKKLRCFILGRYKNNAFFRFIGHPEWCEKGLLRVIHGKYVGHPARLALTYLVMLVASPYIWAQSGKYIRFVRKVVKNEDR